MPDSEDSKKDSEQDLQEDEEDHQEVDDEHHEDEQVDEASPTLYKADSELRHHLRDLKKNTSKEV
jgi:hypothetical protein